MSIELKINGVEYDCTPRAAAAPIGGHGGSVGPAIVISTGGPRAEVDFSANESRPVSFYHAGGTMELVVAVLPGRPGYNTLIDSLEGPGQGWTLRQWTPSGSGGKEHRPVDCVSMPPGNYTYTVSPDTACGLGFVKVQ